MASLTFVEFCEEILKVTLTPQDTSIYGLIAKGENYQAPWEQLGEKELLKERLEEYSKYMNKYIEENYDADGS